MYAATLRKVQILNLRWRFFTAADDSSNSLFFLYLIYLFSHLFIVKTLCKFMVKIKLSEKNPASF